jgi:hypothetical protein
VLDLLVAAAALVLCVLDGNIDQRSISLVFDGCQNQGAVQSFRRSSGKARCTYAAQRDLV